MATRRPTFPVPIGVRLVRLARKARSRLSRRRYPRLSSGGVPPARPVSFVVVRYSDDYVHNILPSECVKDPINQLIAVDNRGGLFYDNLAQAINAGLDRAENELVAVVHEDVRLPPGWQARLERSLAELERTDPRWGALSSRGWTDTGAAAGHWSDPWTYTDTLKTRGFTEVSRIDGQLILLRRPLDLRLDGFLPGVQHIGRDLSARLRRMGLKTYAINAPTIHKYADEAGRRIVRPMDSPKIRDRRWPSYAAEQACGDEYFYEKWPEERPAGFREPDWSESGFRDDVRSRLSRPIVLLARGGSGSRLLSWLARDAGIFIGNKLNVSGDALEMAQAIYMGVLNTHRQRAAWQRQRTAPRIRRAAATMLERTRPAPAAWGFKLPESMLLMPEIFRAFGEARYLHLIRDPLSTCLGRPHLTAGFDNAIGRAAIAAAYRHGGRDPERSLEDSPAHRMAFTTIHQIETVRAFGRDLPAGRYREIRFEDLVRKPGAMVADVSGRLGTKPDGGRTLEREIEPKRAARPATEHRYPAAVEEEVAEILAPLRRELGYV